MFRYQNITDPQTRLDRYLENKHIDIVSPETVSFLFGNEKVATEEILRWEARHEGDYFCLDPARPDVIRITITDHNIVVSNKSILKKNNRRYNNAKKHSKY